jgi:hypothetical protein
MFQKAKKKPYAEYSIAISSISYYNVKANNRVEVKKTVRSHLVVVVDFKAVLISNHW